MTIPFPIKNTIDARRSARSYKLIAVDTEVFESIISFAGTMSVPFDHNAEIKFFKADPTKVLYPFMTSPPDNIAFVAETDFISISKIGFIGELLILFAQDKGISTCWYGHYKLTELERLMPHLQCADQLKDLNLGYGYGKGVTTGRRAICVTPLGYHEDDGLRFMDRITERSASFKRKRIEDLLEHPGDYHKLADDILYALDLGRKAPSAANSQMWRFGFEDDFRTITVAMPRGYRHFKWEHPNVDIGTCACHVWLGLIDKGYHPSVLIDEDFGTAVWRLSI